MPLGKWFCSTYWRGKKWHPLVTGRLTGGLQSHAGKELACCLQQGQLSTHPPPSSPTSLPPKIPFPSDILALAYFTPSSFSLPPASLPSYYFISLPLSCFFSLELKIGNTWWREHISLEMHCCPKLMSNCVKNPTLSSSITFNTARVITASKWKENNMKIKDINATVQIRLSFR